MIHLNSPEQLNPFHRGFAHLALRAPMDDLTIVPVAIASIDEENHNLAPLKLFSLVDPSEPLFQNEGWHQATMYRQVHVLFGHPVCMSETMRRRYRGQDGGALARELTQSCWDQISSLLQQGCC